MNQLVISTFSRQVIVIDCSSYCCRSNGQSAPSGERSFLSWSFLVAIAVVVVVVVVVAVVAAVVVAVVVAAVVVAVVVVVVVVIVVVVVVVVVTKL